MRTSCVGLEFRSVADVAGLELVECGTAPVLSSAGCWNGYG
jgi:hypothetical protein